MEAPHAVLKTDVSRGGRREADRDEEVRTLPDEETHNRAEGASSKDHNEWSYVQPKPKSAFSRAPARKREGAQPSDVGRL